MNAQRKSEKTIYLLPLEQAQERSECGGKAAALSILLQTGFSVPPGFVVKTQGVEALAGKLGQEAQSVVLKELATYIPLFSTGKTFAVRSSAVVEDSQTSSFAGIFQTQLNIQPELTALTDAILVCRDALYNERVYQYMNHHHITFTEGMLAVIIQQMIQPDVAGVAFSKGFTSHGSAQIVVEATPGLGENLVAGRLTPTRFFVPRLEQGNQEAFLFTALRQQGADLPELSHSTLKELCQTVLKIEQVFGTSQDIEWCSLADRLFILQSRPITSELQLAEGREIKLEHTALALHGYGAVPGIVTGKTFVVEDELAVEAFPDGALLLATSTDTEYLSAMQRASAIVTEEGGLLSHAAIISRELRIPCVVGAVNALVTFPTGTLVTVDGYTGTIQAGEGARRESHLDVYDQSDLFCFDALQPLYLYNTRILLEPSYAGPVLYIPSTLNEEHKQKLMRAIQKEVSADIRLGLSAKYALYFAWQSRMEGNPLFRDLFFDLVKACVEMSPERLAQLIDKTYLFTQLLLSELAYTTNDTDLHTLLTAYAKLDTANGIYMLVNTILPEGYGIRSVYQAASPYFTARHISFGEFLTHRSEVKDSLEARIFAVYDLLSQSRESSYLKYKMLGATASTFSQHWTTVLDTLAQLLGLDPEAENFKASLFRQVEASNIWSGIYSLYKQSF